MALFFDKAWFDAALARAGMSRGDLARALGLSEHAMAEVWKDQRELTARDVALIAARLGVPAAEIASRAGVSTPVPREPVGDPAVLAEMLAAFAARLDRVERALAEIKAELAETRHTR